MLSKLMNKKIKNIVIFVSDSLRWDFLPQSLVKKGVVFKTIASSLFTASSFASMLTGLYPPFHGVFSFKDRLNKNLQTLLNIRKYNTSLWTENTWLGFKSIDSVPLYRLLRHYKRISLEDIKPPFIYVEDEKGGHCPYGWDVDAKYEEWDCLSFFKDYGRKSPSTLKRMYARGIKRSVKVFEKRLRTLEERNLLDETLVIFMSDHGELLGEYGGVIGHGNITTPELIYVPVVFIHPSLEGDEIYENRGVLRHVDLYPTILDLLNIKPLYKTNGVSLLKTERLPEVGYAYWRLESKKTLFRSPINIRIEERSVWDRNGGYLFRMGSPPLSTFFRFINLTLYSNSIEKIYVKSRFKNSPLRTTYDYITMFKYYITPFMQYGEPSFNKEIAEQTINKIEMFKLSLNERHLIKAKINELVKIGKV